MDRMKISWYKPNVFPNGTVLRRSSDYWIIRDSTGKIVSRHDSAEYALKKARKIDKAGGK